MARRRGRAVQSLTFLLFSFIVTTTATRLAVRSARPSPLSIPPSQNWDGNDGPWSSFTLQLGSPVQNVRVFISSILSTTWVVRSDGCVASQTTCNEDRGRTFDPHSSTSWKQYGDVYLADNQNIGPYIEGVLGNETFGLGLQGSGGPVLHGQEVAAYTSQDLQMGMFGANALEANATDAKQGFQSYTMSLKNQSMIPSLSFGYTAGNQYRLKKVYGSLTLGGYDSSLFIPNPLSIPFTGNDPSTSLQVTIRSIQAKDQGGKTTNLLSDAVKANIDSTNSMIWLPLDVCKAFEDAFNLKYDQKTNLYLVDSDLHTQLQQQNTSVTFTLSNQTAGGITTDIVLPYASFDLLIKPPYSGISSQQSYFPLRRAVNDSQITLGRTFLQEAYLTVDWERKNFSISQCNFTAETSPKLVAIYSPGEEPKTSMSTGAKVGIGVGAVVGSLLVTAAITYFILRRRRARRRAAEEAAKSGINPKEGLIRQGFAKGEMGAGVENAVFEIEGSDGNALKPYGGKNPPWVDEKAQYPGLGSPEAAEIDGGGHQHRAELGAATGFYGGRGVHEMYDPSSVPPIELPTSSSEMPSPRGELDSSSSERFSPRISGSRPSSSGKPGAKRTTLLPAFMRRSRATSEQSSSGISGPSLPSSPKRAERAFGSRGQAHLISIHRNSERSIPSTYSQTFRTSEIPPPLPSHDYNRHTHQSRSSAQIKSDTSGQPSAPSSAQFTDRDWRQFDRTQGSQRSLGRQSSGPSAPSSPLSPQSRRGTRHRQDSQVSSPSNGNGNDSFSPVSRRGTNDILSPISPQDDEDGFRRHEGYFGGFNRF